MFAWDIRPWKSKRQYITSVTFIGKHCTGTFPVVTVCQRSFDPIYIAILLYKLGLGHVVSGNKITGKTPGISFDLDKAMKIKKSRSILLSEANSKKLHNIIIIIISTVFKQAQTQLIIYVILMDHIFRRFLLCKCINGEKATYNTQVFATKRERTYQVRT